MSSTIEVRELSDSSVADWLAVPRTVYRDDPQFVSQLDLFERKRISARNNPFLRRNEAAFYIAYRAQRPVGRLSVQSNAEFLRRYGNATGHFGFFDVGDDPDVAQALFSAAATWLAARKMERLAGPFSFSINEESGLPIDGFHLPPVAMMPHGAPWQAGMLENCGFSGIKDLLAFRFSPHEMPKVFRWLAARGGRDPRITVRNLNKRDFDNELRVIAAIFNDAWAENWGFLPMTKEDLDNAIGSFRTLFRAHYVKFVCIDGKPEGFLLWAPNLSEIIAPFRGKLLPLNWIRLLYAGAFARVHSARMPLLGIRKAHQGSARAAVLFGTLMHAWLEDLGRYDMNWVECSWVLDSNKPLRTFLETAFGPPARTYRLYEAPVAKLL